MEAIPGDGRERGEREDASGRKTVGSAFQLLKIKHLSKRAFLVYLGYRTTSPRGLCRGLMMERLSMQETGDQTLSEVQAEQSREYSTLERGQDLG